MAATVDTANTPVRWTGTPDNGVGIVSASFTAKADALLVLCVEADTNTTPTPGITITVSDSGGLTWTKRVERKGDEATTGGHSSIWTARTTTQTARTVTVTRSAGSGGTNRISCVCRPVDGADVDGTPVDTVGANNEGGSATNNLTTSSITPGANGLLVAADCEWNALGAFEASSDLTQDTVLYASQIAACDGYKSVTSGVAATANLNASGTAAAQHKWCQIIVREAPAAAASDTWTVRTPGTGSLLARATDFHQRSVHARPRLQLPSEQNGPLPTQPDTWAQPIPGTAFMRSRAVDQARIAATTNYLRWWLAELDGPLPLQPDTYQPPIPGTRALRAGEIVRTLRVTTTQRVRWHGSEHEGPLPEQPDTWTQPPVGVLVWMWRQLLPKRIVFFPSADVTTPPAPPEPDTWAQQPTPGTAVLRASTQQMWRRAARIWPFGDHQDGPLEPQPDTYVQPVSGHAAWSWRRLLQKRVTFFPSVDVPVPPPPLEPDTWVQQPIPGTAALRASTQQTWRRAARAWPWGDYQDGPLPEQLDTYVQPTQGPSAWIWRRPREWWRRAAKVWPWGSYEDGPAANLPTAEVTVRVRADVGTIRVQADVGSIKVRPDIGEVEP